MRRENHPGRSLEFLSRLHDGELSAGERAHFESHRAHCAECRRAAAEFEGALSLFRASPTSPAPPDLAGRILRRLQAATPRRRPFGVFYGIDLRWAGAFAAALVAMIIGSAVVMRQSPVRVVTSPTPIPVRLETNRAERDQDDAPKQSAPAPKSRPASPGAAVASQEKSKVEPPAPAPSTDSASAVTVTGETPQLEAAQPPAEAAPSAGEKEDREKLAALRKREDPSGRTARDEPSGGGRSAAAPVAEIAAAVAVAPPLRFVVTALDGEGSPPAKTSEPALSAEHRGREFILEIGADGRVIDVKLPPDQRRDPQRQNAAASQVPEALRDLRFAAGDRPRRLLLSLR